MIRLCLPLALAIALSGCSGVTVTRLGTSKYPPTAQNDIVVYIDEKDVPTPFERIGIIHTEVDWKLGNEKWLIGMGRFRAAELGANAMLLRPVQDPTTSAKATDVVLSVVSPITPPSLKLRQEIVALRILPPAGPNKAPEPTTTSVTSPAAQETRQP